MGVRSSSLRALRRRLPVPRLLAPIALGVLGAFALFAASGPGPQTVSAADTTVIVDSTGALAFSPKNATVTPGSTVTWRATGAQPHTVTSDGCAEPAAGACTFDSGTTQLMQATGARPTYSFKFDNAGIYSYFCRLHGAPGGTGQAGIITVMPDSALVPSGPPPATAAQLRPNVSVHVVSPTNGQTIVGDRVTVQLGVNGASPRAGVFTETSRTFGHFNLLLDTEVNLNNQVQAVAGVTRATTTTATLENVRPGPHTLTVVWTYDNNVSPQPPITSVVRFTTTAAPAAAPPAAAAPPIVVRPPSTGDGGLVSGSDASAWYIASAGFMLLAALGIVGLARKHS